MNEQITLKVMASGSIIEILHKVPRSRLVYTAPGLEIYLWKSASVRKVDKDRLNHAALTCAISRNIPAISLRNVKAK